MTDNTHAYATFALKLTNIDPKNLHAGDAGALLCDFVALLDEKSLRFSGIRTGSTIVEVQADSTLYEKIIHNFTNNLAANKSALYRLKKTIKRYRSDFPDVGLEFWANQQANVASQLICAIDHQEAGRTFSQSEKLVGRLIKPAHGKDDTDHFTILLANDKQVSVKVNKMLSQALAPHLERLWLSQTLVEFVGIAKYQMVGWEMRLRDFSANGFNIIDNIDNQNAMTQWADTFCGFGQSGWHKEPNALDVWAMERHS